MRRLASLLLAAQLALALAAAPAPAAARGGRGWRAPPPATAVDYRALPPEAKEVIALIRRGGPFPYRRDGVVFENRERRLPQRPRGHYREYTVRTPGAPDRGPRRLVAGGDGALWWSPDHYRTFQQVAGAP